MRTFSDRLGLIQGAMPRCTKTEKLELHHQDRSQGNGIENAEVLCQKCHENTASYGREGKTPKPFSSATREAAFRRAGSRCECTRLGCHG